MRSKLKRIFDMATPNKRETHSDDFTPAQRPDIDLSLDSDLEIIRQNEDIIVDTNGFDKKHFDELAFNEQELTIQLAPTREKNPPLFVNVAVNGINEWIPYKRPHKIKRKFVAVLATCKTDEINTFDKETSDGNIVPEMSRNTVAKHPFTVLEDPDPRGNEWLVRLLTS